MPRRAAGVNKRQALAAVREAHLMLTVALRTHDSLREQLTAVLELLNRVITMDENTAQ